MNNNSTLILASGSPRRLDIMRRHGYEPLVIPSDVNERIPVYHSVCEVPMYLALIKGLDVLMKHPAECGTIISADTVVYQGELFGDGRIMGKPKDKADGFDMLSSLRNSSHYVITGVCLTDISSGIKRVFKEITRVEMGNYSDSVLCDYLDTREAYDKAGGYAIQGTFGKYVKTYEGSYENIVGFPWETIKKELLLMNNTI